MSLRRKGNNDKFIFLIINYSRYQIDTVFQILMDIFIGIT